MRQQEDFRTPADAAAAPQGALATPIFDERSARTAAPVVPLDRVARRARFPRLAGNWRQTVNTPQFRRSWPLALLLVATLVAAFAAASIHGRDDDAQSPGPAVAGAAAETADGAAETADSRQSAAREELDSSREARGARSGRRADAEPDKKSVVNEEAFSAAALGNFIGGAGDAGGEQGDAAAADRGEKGGERDKGKRHKRSKRRHGGRHGGGGAVLFDVIR